MFDLDNITVKEFFQLDDETAKRYIKLQNVLNPLPAFKKRKAKPLGSLSYGEVAQLKRNLMTADYDAIYESFEMVFGVKTMEYLTTDIVSFFYALNWMRKSIVEIIERENKTLAVDIDPDLEMAGVKRLSGFGELNSLIELGEKFSKSPQEIETWNYNIVYSILLRNKVHGEISKSYQEIKSKHKPRR